MATKEAARELAKKMLVPRRELARLERQGVLPSLTDLAQARDQREQAWRKIASLWTAGDNHDCDSLISLHQQLQTRTDDLADELREHADQAAKAEQFRASIAEAEEDAAALEQELRALAANSQEWQARWQALWQPAGVPVLPPEEMAEWRDQWQEFCRRYEHWQSLVAAFASRQETVVGAEQRLREALNDKGAFAVLLDKARRQVAEADKAQGSHSALEEQWQRAKQGREQLLKDGEGVAERIKAASEAWFKGIEKLEFAAATSPAAGMELVGRRKELLQRFDAWQVLRTEAAQLRRQTEVFAKEQNELAANLAFAPAAPEFL